MVLHYEMTLMMGELPVQHLVATDGAPSRFADKIQEEPAIRGKTHADKIQSRPFVVKHVVFLCT